MTTTPTTPDTPRTTPPDPARATPTDRLLTASVVVGPLLYLAADTTYAVRGWDDPAAGVLHVLGAVGYGLVVLRIAAWLPRGSWLAAALVLAGLVGLAGNVGYGFDAIHVSLGDTALVDRSGAATLIKPLGLFVPLSLLLVAAALVPLRRRWQAVTVAIAAVLWPVVHIGNVAAVAEVLNVGLVVGLGSLAWAQPRE